MLLWLWSSLQVTLSQCLTQFASHIFNSIQAFGLFSKMGPLLNTSVGAHGFSRAVQQPFHDKLTGGFPSWSSPDSDAIAAFPPSCSSSSHSQHGFAKGKSHFSGVLQSPVMQWSKVKIRRAVNEQSFQLRNSPSLPRRKSPPRFSVSSFPVQALPSSIQRKISLPVLLQFLCLVTHSKK